MTRPQLPENSLSGRTIVVTGASDGIGRACSRALAQAGATVVMVGRNEAKTAAAARSIMAETGSRTVSWEIANLLRQEAVHELARRIQDRFPHVDTLVNNAGALFLDRQVTPEGLERTFALNHLAYFSLALLLLPSLAASATAGHAARIVNVSSRAHRDAKFRLDDLQNEHQYAGWKAYANSKLENLLFTQSLAGRLDPARAVVHALHPGVVSTRFAVNNGARGRLMRRVMDVVSVDAAAGADTMVFLCADDAALSSTGDYWVKRARIAPSPAALDESLAESLWSASARLAGLDADGLVAGSGAARSALQPTHHV